jgi:hypothetical protein
MQLPTIAYRSDLHHHAFPEYLTPLPKQRAIPVVCPETTIYGKCGLL